MAYFEIAFIEGRSTICSLSSKRKFTGAKLKGGAVPEGRFKEREVILRFFAFANRGNLKRFRNEYMGQFAPRQPDDLKAHTSLLRQTMQNIDPKPEN